MSDVPENLLLVNLFLMSQL